jgi:cytosine/uracil/thiamine/allantoin permease
MLLATLWYKIATNWTATTGINLVAIHVPPTMPTLATADGIITFKSGKYFIDLLVVILLPMQHLKSAGWEWVPYVDRGKGSIDIGVEDVVEN